MFILTHLLRKKYNFLYFLFSLYLKYSSIEWKECWYKNLFKVDVKHYLSLDKFFICSRRWLKTFIPEQYDPLLNSDKFTIGRCRLLL